jgi:hypothetical protein
MDKIIQHTGKTGQKVNRGTVVALHPYILQRSASFGIIVWSEGPSHKFRLGNCYPICIQSGGLIRGKYNFIWS